MSRSLFRKEVLEARRNSWLGGISIAQPVPVTIISCLVLGCVATVVLFLVFGEHTRRSRVAGQLVPSSGLSTVVAPASGIVRSIYVAEGDEVQAAARMALVAAPRNTASGGDAREAVRIGNETRRKSMAMELQSQRQLMEVQQDGNARRLVVAKQELGQIDEEVATRSKQLQLSISLLERYRDLARQRFVSEMDVEEQEQAVLRQQADVQVLQRQYSSMERLVTEIEQLLREMPARKGALVAAAEREMSLLVQERMQDDAERAALVLSPVSGIVSSRLIEPGQSVQAGQPLLTLLPAGSYLQAQLLVPSRAVGFIEPGDRVRLRYEAFPYQKFGHHEGRVVRISRSVLSPAELNSVGVAGEGREPTYRVMVNLSSQSVVAYGQEEPLRPGMLLEADILGERRKFYEWILEPLYAVSGKLGN